MKHMKWQLVGWITILLFLSACSGIPKLPPLNSTITIDISRKTDLPEKTAVETTPVAVISATRTLGPSPVDTGEPSPTLTETLNPEPTPSPKATATREATEPPEATETPTATPYPFGLQQGSPTYLANFAHPDQGCRWLGAAGQIFDEAGDVVLDVVVKTGGSLNGDPILSALSLPGANESYGPGGYELVLSSTPADSEEQVWVQLFDLKGNPLSPKTYIKTYADCEKNLILIHFKEK
ncbi:MAG: hypothetical protein R6U51_00820 [Anaerolineales bacterium]